MNTITISPLVLVAVIGTVVSIVSGVALFFTIRRFVEADLRSELHNVRGMLQLSRKADKRELERVLSDLRDKDQWRTERNKVHLKNLTDVVTKAEALEAAQSECMDLTRRRFEKLEDAYTDSMKIIGQDTLKTERVSQLKSQPKRLCLERQFQSLKTKSRMKEQNEKASRRTRSHNLY